MRALVKPVTKPLPTWFGFPSTQDDSNFESNFYQPSKTTKIDKKVQKKNSMAARAELRRTEFLDTQRVNLNKSPSKFEVYAKGSSAQENPELTQFRDFAGRTQFKTKISEP